MDKTERMEQLKQEALALKTEICHAETKLVWGQGSFDSLLVLVGESPGSEENCLGIPFVGQAGRFLDRELNATRINRKKAYVTNVVKCRTITTAAGRCINRHRTEKEIVAWSGILLRELEIVQPRIILCLGNSAASVLIERPFAMMKNRGKWYSGPFGTRVMATFHPAYVSRFGLVNGGLVQQKFRCDLLTVAAELKNAS